MRGIIGRLMLLCLCVWAPIAMSAAEEPMVVVVSSPVHAKSLNKDILGLIFKRKKQFWSDGNKIQPVNLPASHLLRRSFSQAVFGHAPEDLEKYWNDQYFHGISPPYVLASEEAVLHFVAETPNSIGYVPLCGAIADTRLTIALVITASGHIGEDIPHFNCPR